MCAEVKLAKAALARWSGGGTSAMRSRHCPDGADTIANALKRGGDAAEALRRRGGNADRDAEHASLRTGGQIWTRPARSRAIFGRVEMIEKFELLRNLGTAQRCSFEMTALGRK
jgi:hypothetical protein